jgi:rod shape-determining protein MreC
VKDKAKAALICGLILFHLILISLQVPRGDEPTYFERGFFAVFSPLRSAVVAFFRGTKNFFANYFYFRDVQRQNQSLRNEAFFLRQENQVLRNALSQFRGEKEIREMFSLISRSILAASVIGFDSGQIYKSVTLNRGSLDGVARDMVVLDRQGRLVGRVIDPVTLKQSRVQLVSDEDCGVGVWSERLRVIGVLAGDGRGNCLMKYVLKTNREIETGESVITSGYDGIYPSGIPVGKVISISEDATVFKKVVVEPYFDFSNLDRVAVLAVDLRELR